MRYYRVNNKLSTLHEAHPRIFDKQTHPLPHPQGMAANHTREKQRDTTRRPERQPEEIESILLGDLPAKVTKSGLEITKVSDISSV